MPSTQGRSRPIDGAAAAYERQAAAAKSPENVQAEQDRREKNNELMRTIGENIVKGMGLTMTETEQERMIMNAVMFASSRKGSNNVQMFKTEMYSKCAVWAEAHPDRVKTPQYPKWASTAAAMQVFADEVGVSRAVLFEVMGTDFSKWPKKQPEALAMALVRIKKRSEIEAALEGQATEEGKPEVAPKNQPPADEIEDDEDTEETTSKQRSTASPRGRKPYDPTTRAEGPKDEASNGSGEIPDPKWKAGFDAGVQEGLTRAKSTAAAEGKTFSQSDLDRAYSDGKKAALAEMVAKGGVSPASAYPESRFIVWGKFPFPGAQGDGLSYTAHEGCTKQDLIDGAVMIYEAARESIAALDKKYPDRPGGPKDKQKRQQPPAGQPDDQDDAQEPRGRTQPPPQRGGRASQTKSAPPAGRGRGQGQPAGNGRGEVEGQPGETRIIQVKFSEKNGLGSYELWKNKGDKFGEFFIRLDGKEVNETQAGWLKEALDEYFGEDFDMEDIDFNGLDVDLSAEWVYGKVNPNAKTIGKRYKNLTGIRSN